MGFDFASPIDTAEAVAEEARELSSAADARETFDEMGDLLFAVVSLARRLKVNPEDALRVAGQRFRDRFAQTEAGLRQDGVTFSDLDRDEQSRRWNEAAVGQRAKPGGVCYSRHSSTRISTNDAA